MKQKPDFVKHTRGYLLHNTKPIEAMTEERAIEYLNYERLTRDMYGKTTTKPTNLVWSFVLRQQLPSTRVWRNAWKINEELTIQKQEGGLKEKQWQQLT